MELRLKFQMRSHTDLGEKIYVSGNHPKLGNWDVKQAVEMITSNLTYPMWESGIISLPADIETLSYKYMRINEGKRIAWENFPENRTLNCKLAPRAGTTIVQDSWFCSNVASKFVAESEKLSEAGSKQPRSQISERYMKGSAEGDRAALGKEEEVKEKGGKRPVGHRDYMHEANLVKGGEDKATIGASLDHRCPYCDSWISTKVGSMKNGEHIVESWSAEIDEEVILKQIADISSDIELGDSEKVGHITMVMLKVIAGHSTKQIKESMRKIVSAVRRKSTSLPADALALTEKAAFATVLDEGCKKAEEILLTKYFDLSENDFQMALLLGNLIDQEDEKAGEDLIEELKKKMAEVPKIIKANVNVERTMTKAKELLAELTVLKKLAGDEEEVKGKSSEADILHHLELLTRWIPSDMQDERFRTIVRDIAEGQYEPGKKQEAITKLELAWENRALDDEAILQIISRLGAKKDLRMSFPQKEITHIFYQSMKGLSFKEGTARVRRLVEAACQEKPKDKRTDFESFVGLCATSSINKKVLDEVVRVSAEAGVERPEKVRAIEDLISGVVLKREESEVAPDMDELVSEARKRGDVQNSSALPIVEAKAQSIKQMSELRRLVTANPRIDGEPSKKQALGLMSVLLSGVQIIDMSAKLNEVCFEATSDLQMPQKELTITQLKTLWDSKQMEDEEQCKMITGVLQNPSVTKEERQKQIVLILKSGLGNLTSKQMRERIRKIVQSLRSRKVVGPSDMAVEQAAEEVVCEHTARRIKQVIDDKKTDDSEKGNGVYVLLEDFKEPTDKPEDKELKEKAALKGLSKHLSDSDMLFVQRATKETDEKKRKDGYIVSIKKMFQEGLGKSIDSFSSMLYGILRPILTEMPVSNYRAFYANLTDDLIKGEPSKQQKEIADTMREAWYRFDFKTPELLAIVEEVIADKKEKAPDKKKEIKGLMGMQLEGLALWRAKEKLIDYTQKMTKSGSDPLVVESVDELINEHCAKEIDKALSSDSPSKANKASEIETILKALIEDDENNEEAAIRNRKRLFGIQQALSAKANSLFTPYLEGYMKALSGQKMLRKFKLIVKDRARLGKDKTAKEIQKQMTLALKGMPVSEWRMFIKFLTDETSKGEPSEHKKEISNCMGEAWNAIDLSEAEQLALIEDILQDKELDEKAKKTELEAILMRKLPGLEQKKVRERMRLIVQAIRKGGKKGSADPILDEIADEVVTECSSRRIRSIMDDPKISEDEKKERLLMTINEIQEDKAGANEMERLKKILPAEEQKLIASVVQDGDKKKQESEKKDKYTLLFKDQGRVGKKKFMEDLISLVSNELKDVPITQWRIKFKLLCDLIGKGLSPSEQKEINSKMTEAWRGIELNPEELSTLIEDTLSSSDLSDKEKQEELEIMFSKPLKGAPEMTKKQRIKMVVEACRKKRKDNSLPATDPMLDEVSEKCIRKGVKEDCLKLLEDDKKDEAKKEGDIASLMLEFAADYPEAERQERINLMMDEMQNEHCKKDPSRKSLMVGAFNIIDEEVTSKEVQSILSDKNMSNEDKDKAILMVLQKKCSSQTPEEQRKYIQKRLLKISSTRPKKDRKGFEERIYNMWVKRDMSEGEQLDSISSLAASKDTPIEQKASELSLLLQESYKKDPAKMRERMKMIVQTLRKGGAKKEDQEALEKVIADFDKKVCDDELTEFVKAPRSEEVKSDSTLRKRLLLLIHASTGGVKDEDIVSEETRIRKLFGEGSSDYSQHLEYILFLLKLKRLLLRKDLPEEEREKALDELLQLYCKGKTPAQCEEIFIQALEDLSGVCGSAEELELLRSKLTIRWKLIIVTMREKEEEEFKSRKETKKVGEVTIHSEIYQVEVDSTEVDEKTNFSSFELIEKGLAKGRKLIVFENDVYDIKGYLSAHPEAEKVLSRFIGREIGRLVYRKEYVDILKEPKCGTIKDTLTEKYLIEMKKGKELEKYNWKVESVDGITDTYFKLMLKNDDIITQPQHSAVEEYGKYFTFIRNLDGKARNFSLVFCMQGGIETTFTRVANAVNKKEAFNDDLKDVNDKVESNINLITDPKLGFSKIISYDLDTENEEFKLKGPYGPGLRINPDEEGTVVAIVHDQGLLFFMDLIFYLFRVNLTKLSTTTDSNYMIFSEEDMSPLQSPTFKLVIMYTYGSDPRNIVGKSVIDACMKICKENGYTNFDFVLSTQKEAMWEKETLIAKIPKDASKVWISVPEAEEEGLGKAVLDLGVNPAAIQYL